MSVPDPDPDPDPEPPAPSSTEAGPGAWRLGLLFGALAFLQGVGEPTEGLLAQPVRSLLVSWGRSAGEVAAFIAEYRGPKLTYNLDASTP